LTSDADLTTCQIDGLHRAAVMMMLATIASLPGTTKPFIPISEARGQARVRIGDEAYTLGHFPR
jgi:hypothetical protein